MRPGFRYSEISESVHMNFLKFGTKLGVPNATEVTLSDFARRSKNELFSPKMDISANFLETSHRIFVLNILTTF